MLDDLSPEELMFLLKFGQLSSEGQHAVKWLIKNMGLLNRLIPSGQVPRDELAHLLEEVLADGDAFMTVLTAYICIREQQHG